MFQSIFLAVNLARFYGKRLILFYPNSHLHRGLAQAQSAQTPAPPFLNSELRRIVVEGVTLAETHPVQTVVSRWLDFNRTVLRHPLLSKFVGLGRRIVGNRFASLFPLFVGYSGLEDSRRLRASLGISGPVAWKQVFENAIPIDLTEEQKHRAAQILTNMGLPVGRKFVCLYVRDDGFESRRATRGRTLPNAEIDSFSETIAFLESMGLYVLRVGDPTMSEWTRGGPRFIDYVHSPYYCDVADLYLYKHCEFWVGTMGGGRFAPLAYGRPCVVVNGVYPALSGYCVGRDDVYLPKHVYSKRLKRLLSLREQLERIDELAEDGSWGAEYLAVANTAYEITSIVKDFYAWQHGYGFDWDEPLQSKYWDLKTRRVREAFYDPDADLWKTQTLEETAELLPYMSRTFLGDCWETTSYLGWLTDHYNRHGSLLGVESREKMFENGALGDGLHRPR